MENVLFILLLWISFDTVAILWHMKDICRTLSDALKQLDYLQKNVSLIHESTDDIVQGYDVLTQEIIHLMFGDPRKEGAEK